MVEQLCEHQGLTCEDNTAVRITLRDGQLTVVGAFAIKDALKAAGALSSSAVRCGVVQYAVECSNNEVVVRCGVVQCAVEQCSILLRSVMWMSEICFRVL